MNAPVLHRAIDPAMLGKIMCNPRGYRPHPRLDGPADHRIIGRCLTARAGREPSRNLRSVSALQATIAIAALYVAAFCIGYFAWEFLR